MKKLIALFFLTLLNGSAFADPSQRIYCPNQIICKGTSDSCYVDIPKNYDGNFIYDNYHQRMINDPNGRYIFKKAKYNNGEAFCEYS